jgi:hypothetical protein
VNFVPFVVKSSVPASFEPVCTIDSAENDERSQNEKKFGLWDELTGGGLRYRLDVAGRAGWLARYFKEVDAKEMTMRFWQEIYDDTGKLV